MEDMYEDLESFTQLAEGSLTGARGLARNRATFRVKPVYDEDESTKAGRPIFKDVEYITIEVPGDKLNVVDRPARVDDKANYPRQYKAFKDGRPQDSASGTLLSAWGALSPARVEELGYFNIRTVDALAALSDEALSRMGAGTLKEREHAREYLQKTAGKAPLMRLRAELEKRDAEAAAMKSQLQAQAEAIAELRARAEGQPAPMTLAQLNDGPAPKKRSQKAKHQEA